MNRYDRNDVTSYCLGMSLTIEALKHRSEFVREVILSKKALKNEQFSYLLKLCEDSSVKTIYDDRTIEKLSVKENCYAIGVFDKYYSPLQSDNHIVLYGFDDFGELGTVLRSAVSFDFKDIVLINCDLDYYDPRCIRASMGSFFHTNIASYDDMDEYLKKYDRQNIYPFVSDSSKEFSDISLKEPYSLMISQDYHGLDDVFKEGYTLKHKNGKEISLSVRSSIIFSIIYHLNLRR